VAIVPEVIPWLIRREAAWRSMAGAWAQFGGGRGGRVSSTFLNGGT